MSGQKRVQVSIMVLGLAAVASGCAQVMVFQQPKPLTRDDVLLQNAERSMVVSRFGAPAAKEERQSEEFGTILTETYHYTDGGGVNSFGGKALRVVLYTAGDFFVRRKRHLRSRGEGSRFGLP